MSKKFNLDEIEKINNKETEKLDLTKIGGVSKTETQEEKRREYCITIKPSIYDKLIEIARKEKRKGNIKKTCEYLETILLKSVKDYESKNGEIKL